MAQPPANSPDDLLTRIAKIAHRRLPTHCAAVHIAAAQSQMLADIRTVLAAVSL